MRTIAILTKWGIITNAWVSPYYILGSIGGDLAPSLGGRENFLQQTKISE